jgi:UDP-N-acetylmuramate: L-alanyl-gamma-D-glutamyl-meso-diaminopimelate ligase
MNIHILGICGTFMGSLALLVQAQGHRVTGCDQNVYPPMSTQLEQQGMALTSGFAPDQIRDDIDLYVIGNAISRGNPLLEAILDRGLPYTSGPGLLAQLVLPGKWVLAVSGTHGKTTTTSMLAWILEYAGMAPGFLIGGIPNNFGISARLGDTPFFVIEADEYDCAFFDKRSKFVHYRPRTLIINNLEFDHADIFKDVAAIQIQFHHLVRTLPRNGRIIYPATEQYVSEVITKGCWSETQQFAESASGAGWHMLNADGSAFEYECDGERVRVDWNQTGRHSVMNGVAALLAARHVGVSLKHGAEALGKFSGVKRRMELCGCVGQVSVYDDFAHHPTAIHTTLEGLRRKVGMATVIALIEPRSNTMKMGVHQGSLMASADLADHVIWADLGDLKWLHPLVEQASEKHQLGASVDELIEKVKSCVSGETHIVIMSNGGFAGIHGKVLAALG